MFALNSSNSIIEFLLEGTPVVLENSVDSRRLVDQTLKESCQTFINNSSNTLVSPLTMFLDEVCFELQNLVHFKIPTLRCVLIKASLCVYCILNFVS